MLRLHSVNLFHANSSENSRFQSVCAEKKTSLCALIVFHTQLSENSHTTLSQAGHFKIILAFKK